MKKIKKKLVRRIKMKNSRKKNELNGKIEVGKLEKIETRIGIASEHFFFLKFIVHLFSFLNLSKMHNFMLRST